MVDRLPVLRTFQDSSVGNLATKAFGFLYVQFLLPHCFIPFALLKKDKYWPVIRTTNYLLFVHFGIGLCAVSLLQRVIPSKTEDAKR